MRLSRVSIPAATAAALLAAACGDDAGRAAGPVVRDSAGVRIVEHDGAPQHEAPFGLSPDPVHRHGPGSGDYLFGRIWRGVLFADGRAAIYDAGNAEIVVLGADGATHETLAGPGQGPGEIGFLRNMFAMGADSLLVEDVGNARFTLFGDGGVLRSVGLGEKRQLVLELGTLGIGASGQLLMSSASYRRGFPEAWLQGRLVRLDLDALVADTVASYDWVPYQPPEGQPQNPFEHLGRAAAAGGRFVHGRSDTPEIVWREPDGTVSQIVRWRPDWTYPTDEHWQVFEDDLRLLLPEINPQVQTDEAIEELISSSLARYEVEPDQPLPLFGAFFGDGAGRLWLPEHAVASQRHGYPAYSVISPSGEWLGRVDAPAGLRILDVAHGLVLGVLRDEMDIESVVVHALIDRER